MDLGMFINRLAQIQDNIPNVIDKAFIENQFKLVNKNRENLEQGKDNLGVDLNFKKNRVSALNSSKAYTNSYANTKARFGGQTSYVDLKNTGAFYNSIIFTKRDFLKYTIESKDVIYKYLVSNYGENLLGFTELQFKELFENILLEQIKKEFNA